MEKLKIGCLLTVDRHTLMIAEALPSHPSVLFIDFQEPMPELGVQLVPTKDVLGNLSNYDIILTGGYPYYESAPPANRDYYKAHYDKILAGAKNVVIYDYQDQPDVPARVLETCLVYFKRSWPFINNPRISSLANKIYPLDHGILDPYITLIPVNYYPTRYLDVACMFNQRDRSTKRGRIVMSVRNYPNWGHRFIADYCNCGSAYDAKNSIFYKVEFPSRGNFNWWYVYMHDLHRAKVVLTAFPDSQYGDSRTWEAHASGALVIRDISPFPHPNDFVDGVHCFYFDARIEDEVAKAVHLADYYTRPEHEEERKKIASAGYEHAIKYHTSKARMDYMMDIIIQKLKEKYGDGGI